MSSIGLPKLVNNPPLFAVGVNGFELPRCDTCAKCKLGCPSRDRCVQGMMWCVWFELMGVRPVAEAESVRVL